MLKITQANCGSKAQLQNFLYYIRIYSEKPRQAKPEVTLKEQNITAVLLNLTDLICLNTSTWSFLFVRSQDGFDKSQTAVSELCPHGSRLNTSQGTITINTSQFTECSFDVVALLWRWIHFMDEATCTSCSENQTKASETVFSPRIVTSYNPRMVWVERDLRDYVVPTLLQHCGLILIC